MKAYKPGDTIELTMLIGASDVEVVKAAMIFVHASVLAVEVSLKGTPEPFPTDEPTGQRAVLTAEVPRKPRLGLYRAESATLETFGGRKHLYVGDELGTLENLSFEIVAEPHAKPPISGHLG